MSDSGVSESVIPPPDDSSDAELCRLWIGNLDPRVTEYSLLKILQKYGSLQKFDFLYHKSGPDQGKPRGYCFVTYASKQEAETAMKKLNGKLALSQRLIVKYAHADNSKVTSDEMKAKLSLLSKPTGESSTKSENISVDTKIRAIEAKLQMMEQGIDTVPSSVISSRGESSSNHKRKPYMHPKNLKRL